VEILSQGLGLPLEKGAKRRNSSGKRGRQKHPASKGKYRRSRGVKILSRRKKKNFEKKRAKGGKRGKSKENQSFTRGNFLIMKNKSERETLPL